MDKIFWEFGFQGVDFEFAEEHFERMQVALGVDRISPNHRQQIQTACTAFINRYAAEQIKPERKAIKKRLADIDEGATQLCGVLIELYKRTGSSSDFAERQIARALIHMHGIAGRFKAPEHGRHPLDQDLLALAEPLSSLASAARAGQHALQTWSGALKTGRPREAALNDGLMRLAELFELITGRKPGVTVNRHEQGAAKHGGRFVRFCEAFFAPLRLLPGFAPLSACVTDRAKFGKRCERLTTEYKRREKTSR